jgi:hypothetical protein
MEVRVRVRGGLNLMDASTFGKGEVIIKRNAVFKWRKVGLKIY